MYGDKLITNEFGDYEPSQDPNRGIPTSGSYRVYAYSPGSNITSLDGDNYGTATYIIGEESGGIKFRYDIKNRKKLIYTVGNEIGATEGYDEKRICIRGNLFPGGGFGRQRYPVAYQTPTSNSVRFGDINYNTSGSKQPIAYGSLYFMRLRHNDGSICSRVATGTSGLPASGAARYYNQRKVSGVLDITNIKQHFKVFGGVLNESSAYNSIPSFNNMPATDPTADISAQEHAYPATSNGITDINNVVTFPDRLDKFDTTPPGNTLMVEDYDVGVTGGEKSKEGWYYFFFGLYDDGQVDGNSLVNLKANIDV